MATLQDNGYFYCKACRRDDLTRADYYVDNSKKHGLSNLCKRCERTKKPKHDHYMRSERHQQSLRRQSKRRYYLKKRKEIMIRSRAYKRREPERSGYLLKYKYSLTTEERAEMIEEQQGLCKMCGEFHGDSLFVDHDHETGRVRAMLCRRCNTGLGFFKDDPELLQIAIAYLRSYAIDVGE